MERRAPYRGGRYSSRSPDARAGQSRRSSPRRGSIGDSYVAPYGGGRREGESYRRDLDDRDRGRRERSRDKDVPRRRNSPHEHDRVRRLAERDRYYDRDLHDRHRGWGLSPRRDRRSRSPPRRRTPPQMRRRSRSPPYRSPPPRKRMRVGDRSIETSPSRGNDYYSFGPRSPSQHRRSSSKSPARIEHEKTYPALLKEEDQATSTSQEPLPNNQKDTISTQPGLSQKGLTLPLSSSKATTATKSITTPSSTSPYREPKVEKQEEIVQPFMEVRRNAEGVHSREKQPSPPRQPRLRGGPPSPRSPPRGPRVHLRGNNLPIGPASSHPSGPRGQRRTYPPPASLPAIPISHPISSGPIDEQRLPATPAEPETKPLLIPPSKPLPSLTPELDAEMTRLQGHRAHLASEYSQLAKGIRRALHELDTATIDLRAAELRRRVADAQYERARVGLLGVDYVPNSDTSSV